MKDFYKYFILFHKILPTSLFIKKLFIDIFYVTSMFLSFILPIFLGKIVDNFGNSAALKFFYIYASIYLIRIILLQISGTFRTVFSMIDTQKFLLNKAISNTLKRIDTNFIPEKEMDKIFSFHHIFEFFYRTFAIYVLIVPILMFFSIYMIIINEWKAGAIAIIGFIFIWISSNKKMKAEEIIANKMNDAEYKVSETFSDLYSGYEDIKSYETFPITFNWISKVLTNLKKTYDLYGKVKIRFGLTYELLSILMIPIVTILLSFQVFSGNLSIGKAIMLIVYTERILDYSGVYIQDSDYISWAVARAKTAYNEYLKEEK